ncbi:unnamed protein product [Rhizoctonia solani]|uniref:Zn(2)-C6 fungal-type domain-containing protein n=1 Tax=Rhizoctonia solani TaxID=456999 RepID=A0A8H2WR54_9AGAM|nr:unnamed protein product [Rhizoctonia solani]
MSDNIPLRSNTGCLTCKTRRKKCDETKPKCLRCQRLGVECPGYIYVPYKNRRVQKLRTLPAPPRMDIPLFRGSPVEPYHGPPSYPYYPSTLSDYTPQYPSGTLDFQGELGYLQSGATTTDNIDISSVDNPMPAGDLAPLTRPDLLDFNSSQTHYPMLGDLSRLSSPSASMTPGQASLFQDLLSLGYHQDSHPPISSHNSSLPSISPLPTQISLDEISDETEDDDPEDAITIISYMPTLDPNVESNTLPFILQNYATWVTRRSFEPLKLTNISRKFVFSHFEASFESRWTLVLLANIGGTIGRTGGLEQTQMPLLSALHDSVYRRITSAGNRDESAKALDLALEAIWMHFFVSPIPQAEKLRRAVAPIFRRLHPGPLVNLDTLKDQPFCLRFYAYVDILLGGLTGFPMTFRYYASPALEEPQFETSAHWIVGVPDRLIVLFARMHALREDGSLPSPELVSELEGVIRRFKPVLSESTNSFLCVTRMMVQECWRQVAYIYLYMGVCGESSEGYHVKRAMKQFMTLVKGTKPGRFPDEYLGITYMMVAPAARLPQDRQILISRLVGQYGRNRESGIADNLKIIEDYWARAGAEARPVVWSDLIISRIRVVGM